MDWARASGIRGDKKPWICGSWNVRMQLTYRCVSSICSVTLSTIYNLLSHFDFFISHAPCTASSLSAILVSNFHLKQTDSISEGKASMDLFINDDHFPTEKRSYKCFDSLFLVIHCRCSAVVYHSLQQPNFPSTVRVLWLRLQCSGAATVVSHSKDDLFFLFIHNCSSLHMNQIIVCNFKAWWILGRFQSV